MGVLLSNKKEKLELHLIFLLNFEWHDLWCSSSSSFYFISLFLAVITLIYSLEKRQEQRQGHSDYCSCQNCLNAM